MVTDRPLLALRLTLMHRPRPPTTVYYWIRTFGDGLINNGWRSLDAGAHKLVQAGGEHVNNGSVPPAWVDGTGGEAVEQIGQAPFPGFSRKTSGCRSRVLHHGDKSKQKKSAGSDLSPDCRTTAVKKSSAKLTAAS